MVVNESSSSLGAALQLFLCLFFFFFLIINRFSLVFHLVVVGLVEIFSCGSVEELGGINLAR